MCYSAEAWSLYDAYKREFGADIDIKAFWELYLGIQTHFLEFPTEASLRGRWSG